jgi:signal peptidase
MNLSRGFRRPESRASKALGVVAVLLVVALVVPFVVYSVPAVVGGEESYIVLTASMTPAISPGDAVVVGEVDSADVVVGDVVTYRRSPTDEVPVTHRVIGVVDTADGVAFQTKGDANEGADAALVRPEQLVGKVVLTIPYIGYIVQFVNSPVGFVALVVVPIGLLIASEVYDLTKRGSKDTDASDGDDVAASAAVDGDESTTTSGADTADAPAATATDKGVSLSFTTADLTLSSVLLVAFAAYGGFVAWTVRDSLSIAVAVAVLSVTLVTLAMRFSVEPPAARDGVVTDGGETLGVPTATFDAGSPGVPQVGVGSLDDLASMAGRVGRPLVRDDEGTHYLLFGDVAYTATAPRVEPNATLSAFVTDGDDADPDDDTERRDDASPEVREEVAE